MPDLKHFLFLPDDFLRSDLKAEYPELSDISEFKRVSPAELIFAYCLGCRASSLHALFEKEPTQAIDYALSNSGLLDKLSETLRSQYKAGKFSDEVQVAIKRFERFSPTRRLRAKFIREINFNSLEQMAHKVAKSVNESMGSDETDIDKYKSYSDFIIKTDQSLNEIVNKLEEGFGISEETKDNGDGKREKQLTRMEKVLMSDEV